MKREDRNWSGVREFFRQKIPEVKDIRDKANTENAEQLLTSSVLDEVVETVQRQLEDNHLKTVASRLVAPQHH